MTSKSLKRQIIEKEHEVASILDRIRDLEFLYETEQIDDLNMRRKAYDKLRYTRGELLALRLHLDNSDVVSSAAGG